jgi:hypothetical protein
MKTEAEKIATTRQIPHCRFTPNASKVQYAHSRESWPIAREA